MVGVQGVMTLLLTVSMLWASLFVSGTNGQTSPCSITCAAVFDPVCGSDGGTYGNDCELIREQQCRNPSLYKAHDGPCVFTTTRCETDCVLIFLPVCGSDGNTYNNECELNNTKRCRNPSLFKAHDGPCGFTTAPCETICPAIYRPVCGSDGNTYANQCDFDNSQRCRNPSLFKAHDGPCGFTTAPCETICPAIYRPVCGSDGNTYANQCDFDNAQRCRNPSLYKLYDGPCFSTTTPCERFCPRIYQPVCGSDGKTYSSLCEFYNERRCRNPHLTKLHDGECRGGSGNCDKPCPKHHQPVCGTNDVTYANYCLFEIAHCKWKIGLRKSNSPCSSARKPTASTLMAMMALLGSILLVLL